MLRKSIIHFLIWYFLLGSFIPGSDFSQLCQLDDAYQHFQEHLLEAKEKAAVFDIWDFLWLHYISGTDHDPNQEHNHDDLPLKVFSGSNPFIPLEVIPLFPSHGPLNNNQPIDFGAPHHYGRDHHAGVYHPPI